MMWFVESSYPESKLEVILLWGVTAIALLSVVFGVAIFVYFVAHWKC